MATTDDNEAEPRPVWAVTVNGRTSSEPMGRRKFWFEDLEPLAVSDPVLAQQLIERLVDRFLSGAQLNPQHRDEAISQTVIRAGFVSDDSRRWLVFTLPIGSGNPGFVWDGTPAQAALMADNAADRGIEDVIWDQENMGPTGWE